MFKVEEDGEGDEASEKEEDEMSFEDLEKLVMKLKKVEFKLPPKSTPS